MPKHAGRTNDLEKWLLKNDNMLSGNLQQIKEKALDIWRVPAHGVYTKHGTDHSRNIIEKLGALIPSHQLGGIFDSYSIFILLSAAYLHDIGMQAYRLDRHYDNLDLEQIRKIHHLISHDWIIGHYADFGIQDQSDAEWIARLCKGHRKDNDKDLATDNDYPEDYVIQRRNGPSSIHPKYFAALLRFADSLNIESTRIDIRALRQTTMPVESKLEWWLHYYVSGLRFEESTILIDYRVPQVNPDFWRNFIPKLLTKRMQKDFESCQLILSHHGITIVRIVTGEIITSAGVERDGKMPADVFRQMLYFALVRYDIDGFAQLHLDLLAAAQNDGMTLDKFSKAFKDIAIVPGDCRENLPSRPQDLLADTASLSDLAWIPMMHLSPNTILITDKFALLPDMKEVLKNKNLLIIGSPGVNWVSRHIWRNGPFYFGVDKKAMEDVLKREREIEGMDPVDLRMYKINNAAAFPQLLGNLKGDSLYDPALGNITQAVGNQEMYGVISLCKHPFSDDHYAILIGGPRLLGTMAAEKLLADPKAMAKRPFGGVVRAIEATGKPRGLSYTDAYVDWVTEPYNYKELREILEQELTKKLA
jgi:hypothetical protein